MTWQVPRGLVFWSGVQRHRARALLAGRDDVVIELDPCLVSFAGIAVEVPACMLVEAEPSPSFEALLEGLGAEP